jgi:hypothetical protein
MLPYGGSVLLTLFTHYEMTSVLPRPRTAAAWEDGMPPDVKARLGSHRFSEYLRFTPTTRNSPLPLSSWGSVHRSVAGVSHLATGRRGARRTAVAFAMWQDGHAASRWVSTQGG